MLSDLDVTPAHEWLKEQEQVARSVALVLIIVASHPPRAGRQCGSSFGDQLFATLIEAHFRTFRVIGHRVQVKDMFHTGHKFSAGSGDTPGFVLPGFQDIFFNVCRTASCEMLSTIPNSTSLSASSRKAQWSWSFGGSLHVSATRYASACPSSLRFAPGRGSSFKALSRPPSTNRRRVSSTIGRLTLTAVMISASFKPSSALSSTWAHFILRARTCPLLVRLTSSCRSVS